LGLPRATYYYHPQVETAENLILMRLIDETYTDFPFFGSRRMVAWLEMKGCSVNRKRVQRLMRKMGLEAIYPKPKLSKNNPEHKIYPYLLRGVKPQRPNHIWSTDITYIPMRSGFLYLVAIIDWYSRCVLTWELSNTLEQSFCIATLERALEKFGAPEIFNTDQGAQFTSTTFTSILLAHRVKISMDGRGRALDNIYVERLWRAVKYEDVYLKAYNDGRDTYRGLRDYFSFYNNERPHQSLNYSTPAAIYFGKRDDNTDLMKLAARAIS
jgi:putative transposase